MGNLRKIVGIGLAVAVALGFVAYLLVPHAGPSNQSVVVNQPQAPTTGGNGDTSSGSGTSGGTSGGNSGGTSGGSGTPPAQHTRPPKLHGKNSEGPKHVVCLPENAHVQGVAQYQGANWYRGQCAQVAGANSQGHANGHANGVANGFAQAPSAATQGNRGDKGHGN